MDLEDGTWSMAGLIAAIDRIIPDVRNGLVLRVIDIAHSRSVLKLAGRVLPPSPPGVELPDNCDRAEWAPDRWVASSIRLIAQAVERNQQQWTSLEVSDNLSAQGDTAVLLVPPAPAVVSHRAHSP